MTSFIGPVMPFITYFLAVVLIAYFRGFWAAALTVGVAVLLVDRYMLVPGSAILFAFGRSVSEGVAGFAIASLAVALLLDLQHRTLLRARAAERIQTKIARDLQEANQALIRVNRDLELFTYSAGHDLREPLRTIALMAQMLRRDSSKEAGGLDPTQHIITASERMEKLLRDITAYVGTKRVEDALAPAVDARRVVDEVLESLSVLMQESGARVDCGDLPRVAMHDHRLAQVFQNLISNAIKYRGEAAPVIRIEAEREGDFVMFSISDNGIGIDPKYGEKIFGVFHRLHPASQYPGSGMGLAICEKIVEQYGGRIWLEESRPGAGSTFRFTVLAA